MKRTNVTAIVAMTGIAGAAAAQVELASQTFDDNSTAPQITDNADFGSLQGQFFDGTGLGWGLSFTDTRGTGSGGPVDGSESGDFIGVTDFTGEVGAFPTPAQGFQWNDTDGLVTLSFDAIDATGFTDLALDFGWFVTETGFEDEDFFAVEVNGDRIFEVRGDNLESGPFSGDFGFPSLDLSAFDGLSAVNIDFLADTNSGSETIYLDNVRVTGIPTPGTVAMLGLGGLAAARRRRA